MSLPRFNNRLNAILCILAIALLWMGFKSNFFYLSEDILKKTKPQYEAARQQEITKIIAWGCQQYNNGGNICSANGFCTLVDNTTCVFTIFGDEACFKSWPFCIDKKD